MTVKTTERGTRRGYEPGDDLKGKVSRQDFTVKVFTYRAVGVGRGGAGQCRLTSDPLHFKVNFELKSLH